MTSTHWGLPRYIDRLLLVACEVKRFRELSIEAVASCRTTRAFREQDRKKTRLEMTSFPS